MPRGMNKATIVGYVERDPEVRLAADGRSVASIAVSTTRSWVTSAGEQRQSTEWFHLVAWGRLAEEAGRCLKQGHRVYAEGHLQTRSWEDSEGQRQYRTELVVGRLIPAGEGETYPRDEPGESLEEMALCLNQVAVIGNLGRDPEMRYTPSGQAVTSFSVAASRTWTTADGKRHDTTEWFNVVSWGSLAEICSQFLSKGRRVYVEGELRTRAWQQTDSKRVFRTELVANEMIMLGPRPVVGHHNRDEPPF
jgi:single-strand DNA-binding protein